jgi:lipopolysaccharide/colanic/teichoic acid biosynthesis glycosyltransferase
MEETYVAWMRRTAPAGNSIEGRRRSVSRIDFRRILDLAIVVLALPLIVPLGVLVALAVAADSPGPIFFRCERIGRDGRPFMMWKFRKMRRGATGSPLTHRDDERFTPIGGMLVHLRLDELPQIWNVVRGEMRLVGPRPELREFVDQHSDAYRRILSIAPGITGPSQLAFLEERDLFTDPATALARYGDVVLPLKIAMDIDYVRSRSVRGDLAVVARTAMLPAAIVWRRVRRPLPIPHYPHGYTAAALGAIALVATFVIQASSGAF